MSRLSLDRSLTTTVLTRPSRQQRSISCRAGLFSACVPLIPSSTKKRCSSPLRSSQDAMKSARISRWFAMESDSPPSPSATESLQ